MSRERELLELAHAMARDMHAAEHREYGEILASPCGVCAELETIRAFLATPAPLGEDWALRAANRIADEHKGAWAGVMLQVHWMADVIRECATKDTPAPVTPETPEDEEATADAMSIQIHGDGCAVPKAFFADDSRCTCGLREQTDAMVGRAALPKEEK